MQHNCRKVFLGHEVFVLRVVLFALDLIDTAAPCNRFYQPSAGLMLPYVQCYFQTAVFELHCKKLEPEPNQDSKRSSSWRGATLQPIHHLTVARHSSSSVRLSPALSLSTALTKKKSFSFCSLVSSVFSLHPPSSLLSLHFRLIPEE